MGTAFIVNLPSVKSTNSALAEMAADAPNGTVVTAIEQTAGRGQRGNTWESEPGKNATFSILLRPAEIGAAEQFVVSEAVALAVAETLDGLTAGSGTEVCIKWPNDVYAGDRKICGILIENTLTGRRIERSIAGIGINVNQAEFRSDAPNPVSLLNVTGVEHDTGAVTAEVAGRILDNLEAVDGDADAQARMHERFMSRLWRRRGLWRWLDAASGEVIKASIAGVERDGRLILETADGDRRRYAFKEVVYV